jgi:hypothetical protein
MAPRRTLAHALPYASICCRTRQYACCRSLEAYGSGGAQLLLYAAGAQKHPAAEAPSCFRMLPELGSIRQRRRSADSVCCRSFRTIGSGASSIRHTLLIRHALYKGTAGWHKKSRRAGCLVWLSSIRQHTSQHTSACQSAYVRIRF